MNIKNQYSIQRKETKTTIKFNKDNKENRLLTDSLSNLVNGFTKSESGIHFYTTSFLSLSQYLKERKQLNYEMTTNLITSLYKQLIFLEKIRYTFYSFDPEHIYLVDDKNFICIDNRFLQKLDGENICFFQPFEKNIFCSSEIKDLATIPSFIEKDYYGVQLLKTIMGMPVTNWQFSFAGGTCLAKAHIKNLKCRNFH
jgi:hypothetical protein